MWFVNWICTNYQSACYQFGSVSELVPSRFDNWEKNNSPLESPIPINQAAMDVPFESDNDISVKPIQGGKYIRSRGTQRESLENVLTEKYSTPTFNPQTWIFSSGMNAISSVLCSIFFGATQKQVSTNTLHQTDLIEKEDCLYLWRRTLHRYSSVGHISSFSND